MRHLLKEAATEHVPVHGEHLEIGSYGDINSFFWSHNLPFSPDHIPCKVAFGSLNFRDVMLAYGKLSKDLMAHGTGGTGAQIGLEFSGVVSNLFLSDLSLVWLHSPSQEAGHAMLPN